MVKARSAILSEEGVAKAENLLKVDNIFDPKNIELLHHINQALKAHALFKLDVDYIVKNGEVIIVDEFTGRLMPGRRYSDGLHQALEAKENVKIENENQTLATITFQNYFRMYTKLSGMTGTADTEAAEFKKIYDEYYPMIFQYLTRIVGPDDAEDIAQDAFDRINRGLGGFQGKSKLSTWIYRIATNAAIDRSRSAAYKHATKHIAIKNSADHDPQCVQESHKPPSTDQLVIRKEMSDCVNEFIDNLPPDHKTVIVLSELEGLANKEIAEILEINLSAAKMRVMRARVAWQKAYQELWKQNNQ